MQKVLRDVEAPADLGTDVIGIPQGTTLALQLRVESVAEGVLVSGTMRGNAAGECVRCLDDVSIPVEAEMQELYVYPGRTPEGEDDEDLRQLEDDLVDLEPAIRDAVVLALPFQPVCREDCPGLCATCGARLADDPEHHHDSADPRWAALQGLNPSLHDEKEN